MGKDKQPSVIVSGGAGYLGRSMMDVLLTAGHRPICLDDYRTSRRFKSKRIASFEVDLSNRSALRRVWKTLPPQTHVIHFAALALVPESHEKPAEYLRNNLLATLNLAELASEAKVPFIHSSSCAVYGIPETVPIEEDSPQNPISPYGESKKSSEAILSQFCRTKGLRALNLRYFNPAGSLEGADHGECHEPETHLVPILLGAAAAGKSVPIYGTDYPTPDGSCIRDFLHVKDLIQGHIKAMEWLDRQSEGYCDAINLGSGTGSSVLEVVRAAETVMGRSISTRPEARRPGDPPKLVASIKKAASSLGWAPASNLEEILRSHLDWEKRRLRKRK